ncbi:hypothetical protein [Yoonia sp. MH D7]
MTEHQLNEYTTPLAGHDFSTFHQDLLEKSALKRWLDRQDISADAKMWIVKVSEMTVTVGKAVISIGLKIVTTIFNVLKAFPQTTFGVIVGAVLTLLISSIPLIGVLVGPILMPIFLAFGVGMGAIADFQASSFRARMDAVEAEYAVLRP